MEKCKHNAIELNGELLIIDTKKCTLCGECMIACPSSAIEGVASNRNFEKGSLIFDKSYTPSLKELLIYKKRGMTSIQISDQALNQEWEKVLVDTNKRLKLLDESPITVTEKVRDEVLSRRAFFGSFQREGKQLAKRMAPVAWKMEQDDWKITKYFPNYQFYSVEINPYECTLCQTCFSLCGEVVFKLMDGKLLIKAEWCVNCTSCRDVCPEEAIKIQPEIKRKNEQYEFVHSKTCKDCGHTFYTFDKETEKCHMCKNRDPDWLSPYE
ncbi:Fe-S-cluster-containing hydrogenase component 2 [Bacillus niacini]|uniref:Fe-S-cluster-containing hydrogenase component 2 n=2 Tax=Neobacillus TaxID=2675232 RepID=A0A852T8Q8_9BACI|nr:4Fe-4S dicluster domain-containing protein [Neobacillus niacini]NYE04611.1 Fe-S-cluster-containing hydrogenase component 2 [Neobacillus niacini]